MAGYIKRGVVYNVRLWTGKEVPEMEAWLEQRGGDATVNGDTVMLPQPGGRTLVAEPGDYVAEVGKMFFALSRAELEAEGYSYLGE